jgi:hypothetical protein
VTSSEQKLLKLRNYYDIGNEKSQKNFLPLVRPETLEAAAVSLDPASILIP